MIKHKKALYEIFSAAMEAGGSLENKCDVVIKTASILIPGAKERFIAIGSFSIGDVVVGRIKDKYTVIYQDIMCGATVKARSSTTAEEDAEDKAFELARLVRTLLKNNLTLVSTSFPEGIARTTRLRGIPVEPMVYGDSPCFIGRVSVIITLKEDVN